ncbi:hypothetical protein Glove_341g91 [Diversispora epigaea]|uniref:Uncharacterized protein n=1 Tax=Diversispora epigaea TaxID=1348612 RepID=A0A397HGT4_9GLOM|nr:hypothetical protein Glove_341g91 [Diversispora epigaea]
MKNFTLWCGVDTIQRSPPTNSPKGTTSLPTSSQSNKPKTHTLQLIITNYCLRCYRRELPRSKYIKTHDHNIEQPYPCSAFELDNMKTIFTEKMSSSPFTPFVKRTRAKTRRLNIIYSS